MHRAFRAGRRRRRSWVQSRFSPQAVLVIGSWGHLCAAPSARRARRTQGGPDACRSRAPGSYSPAGQVMRGLNGAGRRRQRARGTSPECSGAATWPARPAATHVRSGMRKELKGFAARNGGWCCCGHRMRGEAKLLDVQLHVNVSRMAHWRDDVCRVLRVRRVPTGRVGCTGMVQRCKFVAVARKLGILLLHLPCFTGPMISLAVPCVSGLVFCADTTNTTPPCLLAL